MIGRREQKALMKEALELKKSSFIAVTGRRRVGKTYLVREIYKPHYCFSITGIQNGPMKMQIANFLHKIEEYSETNLATKTINNWQEVFFVFKNYLKSLPNNKKQVIFIDELPWIATAKSGFIQLLAHLWNDYLSEEKHFILVICGSSTSWITKKIINDRGGFHNRVTIPIHLKPFTIAETKQFLEEKNIQFTDTGISEIYMVLGGIPYYLEQIKKGESPTKAIERLCFSENGILKNEYNNLYRALFDNWELHEKIVEVLALTQKGLTRNELLKKTNISTGGNFNRTVNDLITSDFISTYQPYGHKKKNTIYKLSDEFSVFHNRFIKVNRNKGSEIWQTIAQSQKYKIWKGFAFESLCLKHINEIKKAMGIEGVYTENSSYFKSVSNNQRFQIDLIIDRKDATINLCECKFYESNFEIDKKYAEVLKTKKVLFRKETNTKKMLLNTFIANEDLVENRHSLEVVDQFIHLSKLINQ